MLRKGLIVLAVAIPLGLVACGGDDDETTSAETSATTTEAAAPSGGGQTVKVSEVDFEIKPADPSVKAGSVTFDVTNDGETVHNLEIEGNGIEQELDADLNPGDSGQLAVDLQPGTYEWYCPVGNHRELGMEGTVTVK